MQQTNESKFEFDGQMQSGELQGGGLEAHIFQPQLAAKQMQS
jgi:hypothetical protein